MGKEGYVSIVNRKKNMINVSTLKGYPREIKEWLLRVPESHG
jgi:acyl-CoA synthetase (AMP-forming)/AMP-acid ligase II